MVTRNSPRKKRRITTRKRLAKELSKYGIDEKLIGPLVLPFVVAAILHAFGVAFSLGEEGDALEARVDEVLEELDSENQLGGIVSRIGEDKLRQGLKSVIRQDWLLEVMVKRGTLAALDAEDIRLAPKRHGPEEHAKLKEGTRHDAHR